MTDVVEYGKSAIQNLCMSLESIPQEVFCANNTTRNGVVELSEVCYAMCARIWKTFSKLAEIKRK